MSNLHMDHLKISTHQTACGLACSPNQGYAPRNFANRYNQSAHKGMFCTKCVAAYKAKSA